MFPKVVYNDRNWKGDDEDTGYAAGRPDDLPPDGGWVDVTVPDGGHRDDWPPERIRYAHVERLFFVLLGEVGQAGEYEDDDDEEEDEESQFLVALAECEAEGLESDGVPGKLQDPEDPHHTEYLNHPPASNQDMIQKYLQKSCLSYAWCTQGRKWLVMLGGHDDKILYFSVDFWFFTSSISLTQVWRGRAPRLHDLSPWIIILCSTISGYAEVFLRKTNTAVHGSHKLVAMPGGSLNQLSLEHSSLPGVLHGAQAAIVINMCWKSQQKITMI